MLSFSAGSRIICRKTLQVSQTLHYIFLICKLFRNPHITMEAELIPVPYNDLKKKKEEEKGILQE